MRTSGQSGGPEGGVRLAQEESRLEGGPGFLRGSCLKRKIQGGAKNSMKKKQNKTRNSIFFLIRMDKKKNLTNKISKLK